MDRQSIADIHREQWERYRQDIFDPAYSACAANGMKEAESVAKVLKIMQEAERKTWDWLNGAEAGNGNLEVSFEDD